MDPQIGEYFSSYEDLEVHKLMLEDEPRILAYKNAILKNKSFFKDKIVMDVGCGTGLLSVFCAQAGAKKVYAIEANALANLAKEIVKENGFEEVVMVIHEKVENVVLPTGVKVDAIVSEWMGHYLLHEGMLDSVLYARDNFLKAGGAMFPETAVIYVAPCSVTPLYKKLENINGVLMTSFARRLRESKVNSPQILDICDDDLLGEEVILSWINLKEDKMEDLSSFSIKHVLGASKDGSYQGLCIWFECIFPNISDTNEENRVILNTGPRSLLTHWKQTIILLQQEQMVEKGQPIAFQLDLIRDSVNNRRYNFHLVSLDPDVVEHPQPCSCYMTKCIIINKYLQQHAQHAMENNLNNTNVLVEDTIDDDANDD